MQSLKQWFLISLGSTKQANSHLFIHPSLRPSVHPFHLPSVTKILAEHGLHPLLWFEESEVQIRHSHGLLLLLLVAKSSPTLSRPMDSSPPDSSVRGIFQARTLEWAAISSSRGSSQSGDWICVSCTGRRIFYHWATWEAPKSCSTSLQKTAILKNWEDRAKRSTGSWKGRRSQKGKSVWDERSV